MCVRRKSCTVKSFVGGEEWTESLLPDPKIYVTVDVSFSFLTITQEHMSWHLNQVSWPSSFQMLRHLFFFAIFFFLLSCRHRTHQLSLHKQKHALLLWWSLCWNCTFLDWEPFRFGRPGVECYCQHESGAAVIQLQFLINEVGYKNREMTPIFTCGYF